MGQRYGVGLALGDLIHSEVEGDLRRKGYRGYQLNRVIDIIFVIDAIYREIYLKSQESRRGEPAPTDGARTLISQREAEMERGSKAV